MGRGGRAVRRGRPGAGCRRCGEGNRKLSRSAQPGPRSDGQIEMDVVHALDASAALKNDLITAATIQGEVTLSGTVSTDASKQLAESIAAHVDGVTKVHNNLQIGNPGPDAQALQPAPGSQEMPDADQSQTQQRTAGCRLRDRLRARDPNPPPNESQAPATPPNPQQGAYPPPPPQRPQYQSPQYSQYPPQYPPAPRPIPRPVVL